MEIEKMKATTQTRSPEPAHKKALKIGEVSRLSGVGIEALRFYEKQGLLGRPARTQSGYRLYDAEVLERLEFIKRAQVLGFSLAEIARIIAHKHAGQSPCAEVRGVVRARLQEIDARIRQMRRYRKELASALAEWEQMGDREGHICGLIEGTAIKHTSPEKPVLKRGRR
jgi:MerR family transcriptional regulator, copper efflux regulator